MNGESIPAQWRRAVATFTVDDAGLAIVPVANGSVAFNVTAIGEMVEASALLISRRRVPLAPLPPAPSRDDARAWVSAFLEATGLATAREAHVRAPATILDALQSVRGEARIARTSPATDAHIRRASHTFAAPMQHWQVTPPQGHQLSLHVPFDGSGRPSTVDVRRVLSGPLLRAYLATWALVEEAPHDLALFDLDVRHVLLDLYGLTPAKTTVRGKVYARPPTSSEKELHTHIGTLSGTYLESVDVERPDGKRDAVRASAPEPLISFYEDRGRTRRIYRHATLATAAMKHSFVQLPRAVLRLPSADVPLALAVAGLWRTHAREALRAGALRVRVLDLARAVASEHQRRDRGVTAYVRGLRDDLDRVARDGGLASGVHVEGDGLEATVTLDPTDSLALVYSGFADLTPALPPAEVVEAEVERRLQAPRPRGRPRRPRQG